MDKQFTDMTVDELKEFASKNEIKIHHAVKTQEKCIEIIEAELANREPELSEISELVNEPITEDEQDVIEEKEVELTIDEKIVLKEKEISQGKVHVSDLRVELAGLIAEKNKARKRLTITEINSIGRERRNSTNYLEAEKEKQEYLKLHKKYGV